MKKFLYGSLMFLFPIVSFAAAGGTGINEAGPTEFVRSITNIINTIIPLLVAVAVLIFIYGVLKYILAGTDDAAKRTEARGFMIWGIVAIFVMVSVWGLVGILSKASGVEGTNVNVQGVPNTPATTNR